jgi:hypothetical protein
MDLVTSIKCPWIWSSNMKMTDSHAFIQNSEPMMISFKNTHYLRSHECKTKLTERAGLQYIISNQKLKDVFAIYAPSIDPLKERMKQPQTLLAIGAV